MGFIHVLRQELHFPRVLFHETQESLDQELQCLLGIFQENLDDPDKYSDPEDGTFFVPMSGGDDWEFPLPSDITTKMIQWPDGSTSEIQFGTELDSKELELSLWKEFGFVPGEHIICFSEDRFNHCAFDQPFKILPLKNWTDDISEEWVNPNLDQVRADLLERGLVALEMDGYGPWTCWYTTSPKRIPAYYALE